MKLIRNVFDYKGGPFLVLVFAMLVVAERKRQLRKQNQSRAKRYVTNSIVAVPSFSLLRFLFLPMMVKLAMRNKCQKWGLDSYCRSHPTIKAILAFLIMDYGNYLWHLLNHKVPLLWRFHLVHHTDVDLDVTTAIRFHFGELIGSVFSRGFFVVVSGATALQVLLYEVLFETATQFHHSNWKLPFRLEKSMNAIVVTPRMHGIHHSIVKTETDSNYSVVFSFWDRMHGTMKLNVPQQLVVTGVPAYSNPKELTPGFLLKLPFTAIRPWRKFPDTRDGSPDELQY
jgi:sterol desaturase/sphingolipid hydroxylase (fatty acid hydroxylase superfamily)